MYADMALTVADYLYKMVKSSSQGIGMDVCQMKVMKPLIVNSDLGISQILQLSAVSAVDLCSAVLSFSGVDSNGNEFVQYAECIVEYKDPASWLSVWGSIDFLVLERVLSLKKAGSEGLIPKITRGLAYKLLAVTVDYDAKFRGMDIILLDGQKFEATAEISFQASEGTFCYNPVWIDSLCQLSGFVLYASDAIDSRRFSFINHGWKYMRFARPLVDKRYRSYVRMFAGPGNTYEGNVYVLDEQDMIVGVFGGVVFQKVHRTVLDEVLSSQSPSARRKSRSGLQPISLPEQNNRQVRPQPVVAEELPGTHQTVLKNNDLGSSALSLSVVQKTSSLMARIERIIVENADLDIADLQGDVSFRDLGIDSLLSLSIVAQLREDLDLDIPGSLFLDYPTVKSLRLYLVRFDEAEDDELERSISTISSRNPHSSPMTSLSSDEPFNTASYPPAKSVLLQGNRSTATKTLFLFPDGSGSAASYASIPLISSDLIVYALDCPFRTTPEDWDVGCPGVATLYLAEIRRRQPFGPYMLGGWSAGGIIAYEAMQQLLAAGEAVEHLILLDVPCPLNIQAFPPGVYKFFHDIGVLGHPNYNNKDTTLAWLIPHFEACIKNLVAYNPLPILNPVKIPKIFAIWARYGVCGAPGSPSPDFPTDHPPHLVWLLENRTDFGPNEWLKLMPDPHRFRTEVVDANHFTLMRDPVVSEDFPSLPCHVTKARKLDCADSLSRVMLGQATGCFNPERDRVVAVVIWCGLTDSDSSRQQPCSSSVAIGTRLTTAPPHCLIATPQGELRLRRFNG
jgi:naphtho-gamma-pyrone polyketide synthase